MQGYGPFTATLQQIVTIPVDQNTSRVHFYNDSTYDCMVSVGTSPPSNKSSGLTDGWQAIVPAMHDAFIPTGRIVGAFYALPVNTRGASLATNGTTSVLQNLWFVTLGPGETEYDVSPAIREHDISSQQRVITLPCAPQHPRTGITGVPAVGVLATLQTFTPTPNPGPGGYYVYCYYAQIMPGFTIAGTGAATVQIRVDVQNNGGVSLGFPFPYVLAQGIINWQNTGTTHDWDFFPPYPVAYPVPVTTNFPNIVFQLYCSSISVPENSLAYNVLCDIDAKNSDATGSYGPAGIGYSSQPGLYTF